MRLFIAIPLEEKARQGLARLQGELKQSKASLKLVEKQNLHMTLRFIGEGDAGEWIKKIDSVQEKPFELVFDRVGAFPSNDYVRVVWAGCPASESLLNIHRVIGEGEPSPHVTIARLKTKPDEVVKGLLGRRIQITSRATKIQLMNSVLGPGGPRYEVMHEKTL